MAGQARVVLFTWVCTPAAIQQESQPLRTTDSPRGSDQHASRQVGAGLIGWRLIGANNRELGRAAHPDWDVDLACQTVGVVKDALARTIARLSWDTTGGWSWQMSLDGKRVAESGRGYLRQRECSYSLEQFRERLPTAAVQTPHARLPRPTSPETLFPGVELGGGHPAGPPDCGTDR